ncbi:uncharacterized protein SCHCODRAFT_02639657 [Schizophyllum commune H4-8]|uniref:uncharacterized protein n=1 Tax=Schizophyllum commune (strain H4-8 / FGSC 9210) TaxID=578458 RepID=UPI00215E5ACC|nr:uncharacterized protein SCHCODRAFT_02639657 [Schizophyllum commune H4-8]KAI5888074.1 hypothetical protein SCHCODRAFT_02639657 [Schizophyllum commune H4-8]
MLDVLASLEGPVIESLHGLGEYVIQEFSYPPVIHFFVMRVLGPDSWGCVKEIEDVAAQLRVCAEAMRSRFSLAKLSEIRTLSEDVRGQLDLLIVRASGDLPI